MLSRRTRANLHRNVNRIYIFTYYVGVEIVGDRLPVAGQLDEVTNYLMMFNDLGAVQMSEGHVTGWQFTAGNLGLSRQYEKLCDNEITVQINNMVNND